MPTYTTSLGTRADLELYISSGTQQVDNNRTYVYYRLRILRKGTSTASSTMANPYTVKINGSTVANSTSTYNTHNNSTITLASGNVWVNHNADGTKTVAVSGTFRDLGGYLGGGTSTKTVSGSPTLPTIARASTPRLSASSVAAGSSFTVYTDRASSSFTHTIEVTLGTYKITQTGVTTSRAITVNSASALGQMSNVTSRNATVSLKTYNGSTLIGTRSTSISVTVPSNITPTVGTLSVTETVSAVSSLGLASGVLVSGVSIPRLQVTGSTAGTGSSISTQTLDFDGITTTTTDYTLSRAVRGSGTLPFKVTTRDARARSATKTQNVTVLSYQTPVATVNSSDRSTSGGVISNTGTYIKLVLSGIVSSLMNGSTQRNTLQLKIESKLKGASDSTYEAHVTRAITVTSSETWSGTETFTRTGGFEETKAYTLRITVTDALRSSSVNREISTGSIALHFDANLGVGIGKYRSQGMLDVAGNIRSDGSINASTDLTAQGDVEAGGLLKGSGLSIPSNFYHGRITTTNLSSASTVPIPRFAYGVTKSGDIANGGTTGYHMPTKGRYVVSGSVMSTGHTNPGTYHYIELTTTFTSMNHRFPMTIANNSATGKAANFYAEIEFPGGTFQESGLTLTKIGSGEMDVYGVTTSITSHILIRQISV